MKHKYYVLNAGDRITTITTIITIGLLLSPLANTYPFTTRLAYAIIIIVIAVQ